MGVHKHTHLTTWTVKMHYPCHGRRVTQQNRWEITCFVCQRLWLMQQISSLHSYYRVSYPRQLSIKWELKRIPSVPQCADTSSPARIPAIICKGNKGKQQWSILVSKMPDQVHNFTALAMNSVINERTEDEQRSRNFLKIQFPRKTSPKVISYHKIFRMEY